jgi:hypothetical protein
MTGSVKIASRVNAVVPSEVQRAEDLALITGVLVARGLRPRKAERLPIDALAEVGVGERSGGVWAFRSRASRTFWDDEAEEADDD